MIEDVSHFHFYEAFVFTGILVLNQTKAMAAAIVAIFLFQMKILCQTCTILGRR